jgi:hypothetical protein
MKKIILFFAFLLLIGETYCQTASDSTSKEKYTKQYYLQKSKNQKDGAWVLLIGGAAIFAGTGLYASHNLDFSSPEKHRHIVPISLGIACVASSILLFIEAGRNKLKSARLTTYFEMEQIPILQQTGINLRSYPAVSIRLNL